MNTQIKKRWLEALRSGDYKKGRGSLHSVGEFCCLGVLCDLLKDEVGLKWELNHISYNHGSPSRTYYKMGGCGGSLPYQVRQYAGLALDDPRVASGRFGFDATALSEYNDFSISTFDQIATLIEESL